MDEVKTPTTEAAPATGATPTAAGSEPAAPSHRDWNGLAQNQRQLNETMQGLAKTLGDLLPKLVSPGAPQQKPEPSVQSAATGTPDAGVIERISRLERDNAVKSAIVDHSLTGDARATFEEMAALVPSDQIKSIAEKIARLSPGAAPTTAPAAAAPIAPTVKPGSSNAGPAAPSATPIIPDRLEDIPKDVLRNMSAKELRDRYDAQKRALGQGNPFAQARETFRK